MYIEGKTLYVT